MLLSTKEIALAANADVMLTKNRIIEAVYQLFGRLAEAYAITSKQLPETLLKQHAKIAKGENYLGLPWIILDYPRNFGATSVLAIRTMFWWGNYFSLQLLLKGEYLQMLNIAHLMSMPQTNEWFFCTGGTPWQHHFEEDYMQPLHLLSLDQIEKQKDNNGFYKIGMKLPIANWQETEQILTENFLSALRLILPLPEANTEPAAINVQY